MVRLAFKLQLDPAPERLCQHVGLGTTRPSDRNNARRHVRRYPPAVPMADEPTESPDPALEDLLFFRG